MVSRLSARVAPAIALLAALTCIPAVASAQQCLGLTTASQGFLTFGFEGTDGATGEGLGFGYHNAKYGVLIQRQSLDDFTVVDELETLEARLSYRPAEALPLCIVGGLSRTAYHTERAQSWSWNDPGYVDVRHTIGGPYRRLRIPVGIAIGRQFDVGPVALVPHLTPSLVYERESHDLPNGSESSRQTWGFGGSAGLTLGFDWVVVRSSLTHTVTHEYALSGKHNFPLFSLQVGVGF